MACKHRNGDWHHPRLLPVGTFCALSIETAPNFDPGSIHIRTRRSKAGGKSSVFLEPVAKLTRLTFVELIDLEAHVGKDTYLWACGDVGAAPATSVLKNLDKPKINLSGRNMGTKGAVALSSALKVTKNRHYDNKCSLISKPTRKISMKISKPERRLHQNAGGFFCCCCFYFFFVQEKLTSDQIESVRQCHGTWRKYLHRRCFGWKRMRDDCCEFSFRISLILTQRAVTPSVAKMTKLWQDDEMIQVAFSFGFWEWITHWYINKLARVEMIILCFSEPFTEWDGSSGRTGTWRHDQTKSTNQTVELIPWGQLRNCPSCTFVEQFLGFFFSSTQLPFSIKEMLSWEKAKYNVFVPGNDFNEEAGQYIGLGLEVIEIIICNQCASCVDGASTLMSAEIFVQQKFLSHFSFPRKPVEWATGGVGPELQLSLWNRRPGYRKSTWYAKSHNS